MNFDLYVQSTLHHVSKHNLISTPDSRNYPNSGFTQFVPARNDVPDEVSWTDTINIPPNNLIPNPEDIGLIPPVQLATGKRTKETIMSI